MKATGVLIIAGLLLAFAEGLAQVEMSGASDQEVPVFHFDVVNVASPVDTNLSRLRIFVKIAYDELSFVRTDSGYLARYEVSMVLFDERGEQAAGKILSRHILTTDFDATNSRTDFDITEADFDVRPSDYRLAIGLMDMETRRTGNRKAKVLARDFFHSPLSLSDVLLASFFEGQKTSFLSGRSKETGDRHPKSLNASFEIYSRTNSDSVRIDYTVRNSRNERVLRGSYWKRKVGLCTPETLQIDPRKLQPGRYFLQLAVSDGILKDHVEKMFNASWSGLPPTISDLELAIEQVRYIATRDEWSKLKKAKPEEKPKLFQEFWARRDPTPGTPANEAMDEHYRRVQYANENFSGFQEGWKTDMGMVYIVLGPPDDIERHPFDVDSKPYEIWYYYSINRQFIFVDENGFGEYRLYNPYALWDWQRMQE
ncbi:MAG: GWxTD domain-containing protein [candidate division KSB1 bacterium]|nr:GWxTD domain-containing protein [candidate division KSB1 bacterium]